MYWMPTVVEAFTRSPNPSGPYDPRLDNAPVSFFSSTSWTTIRTVDLHFDTRDTT